MAKIEPINLVGAVSLTGGIPTPGGPNDGHTDVTITFRTRDDAARFFNRAVCVPAYQPVGDPRRRPNH